MEMKTKVIIGSGLVATTGLALYAVKRKRNNQPNFFLGSYVFETHDDAEIVLDQLKEKADKFDIVTVVDYYDLIDEGSSYILNSYGWSGRKVYKAKIKKRRKGFEIIFPKLEILK